MIRRSIPSLVATLAIAALSLTTLSVRTRADHPLVIGAPLHPVHVVRTLEALKAEPRIAIAPGMTARLGIEKEECAGDGGVLIYTLIEWTAAAQWPTNPDGSDCNWGPLNITVPYTCNNTAVRVPIELDKSDDAITQPGATTAPATQAADDGDATATQPATEPATIPAAAATAPADPRPPHAERQMLLVYPICVLSTDPIDCRVTTSTGTLIGKFTIHPVGAAEQMWFGMTAGDNAHPPAPALGKQILPTWDWIDGLPLAPGPLPHFETSDITPGVRLARTPNGLRLTLPQTIAPTLAGEVMLRWWINDQPVVIRGNGPVPEPSSMSAARTRTLDLPLNLRPEDFGAAAGDTISVQLAIARGGWETCEANDTPKHQPGPLTLPDANENAVAPCLSNRISWTLTAPPATQP